MNYKNLEWFYSSQRLNHQQAQWSLFLLHFNYKLTHKAGVTNKSDGLSRLSDHKEGVEFDNLGETLLDPKLFNETRKVVWRPFVEVNTITTEDILDPYQVFYIRAIKQGGVTIIDKDLKKCIIEENKKDKWLLERLILHRGKIYIPQNKQLCWDIIKINHNNLVVGHLRQREILAIVEQEFTWPGISNTIHQYVEGYTICQSTKNNTHPTMVPLQLMEILDRLFGTIIMDFITNLPKSNRYDSLYIVTDRFTKRAVITLCQKFINLDRKAKILLENTWRQYGLPDKIILDKRTQFTLKVA